MLVEKNDVFEKLFSLKLDNISCTYCAAGGIAEIHLYVLNTHEDVARFVRESGIKDL
jgi:hypothetical protein